VEDPVQVSQSQQETLLPAERQAPRGVVDL
jgi:hypothetical protein